MQVVVAIDFGTARTGYAFAFLNDPDREVYPRLDWPHQTMPYYKTLSNLLYDPENRLVGWGFTAPHMLAQLKNDSNRGAYQHIIGYKLQLKQGRPGPRGPVFEHDNGRTYAVVDLIADYLGQIRTLVVGDLQKAWTAAIAESDILWCMTVPAIWTDADKQVMRMAAEKAGLVAPPASARLLFALEPEAAALYCQEKDSEQGRSMLTPGTRLMVVDAGGGTVYITVHEVAASGLREVVAGTGGQCGSIYLDGQFTTHLQEVLGEELFERLCEEEPTDLLDLLRQWEREKCGYAWNSERPVLISIPRRLGRMLDEPESERVLRRLGQAQGGDEDNFHLSPAIMKRIFTPVLEEIRRTVERQFQALGNVRCDYLFLVGGFAASPALQSMIETTFGSRVRKVIVPPDPGKAVVVGAALYALDQSRISARVSRLTYGCGIRGDYDPVKDRGKPKVYDDYLKKDRCDDVFDVFVTAGQLVELNQTVQRTYYPTVPDQTFMTITIHTTKQTQVRHTTEAHVETKGQVRIAMPDLAGGRQREVEVFMYFGRTEIRVEAVNKKTGEKVQTTLDFLTGL